MVFKENSNLVFHPLLSKSKKTLDALKREIKHQCNIVENDFSMCYKRNGMWSFLCSDPLVESMFRWALVKLQQNSEFELEMKIV